MNRLRRPNLLPAVLLALGLALHAPVHASVPLGYQQVAEAYDLPPEVLYALALTESARQVDSTGNVRPWPWTLNVRGRGHFLIGSDGLSREWFATHRDRLAEIGAVGMLVEAETLDDLRAIAAIADGLPILPASASDIAEALGLSHYPVLITKDGIEQ